MEKKKRNQKKRRVAQCAHGAVRIHILVRCCCPFEAFERFKDLGVRTNMLEGGAGQQSFRYKEEADLRASVRKNKPKLTWIK